MWGDNWGELIWGGRLTVVPVEQVPISAQALVVLGMVVGVIGAKLAQRRGMRLLWITRVALLPALAVAVTVKLPHTFENATVADEANANFAALVTESDAQGMRTTLLESLGTSLQNQIDDS